MVTVDADGHVEESEATFAFLEKEYYERRPLALGFALKVRRSLSLEGMPLLPER